MIGPQEGIRRMVCILLALALRAEYRDRRTVQLTSHDYSGMVDIFVPRPVIVYF
jgi:hypothetical protein